MNVRRLFFSEGFKFSTCPYWSLCTSTLAILTFLLSETRFFNKPNMQSRLYGCILEGIRVLLDCRHNYWCKPLGSWEMESCPTQVKVIQHSCFAQNVNFWIHLLQKTHVFILCRCIFHLMFLLKKIFIATKFLKHYKVFLLQSQSNSVKSQRDWYLPLVIIWKIHILKN